MNAITRTISAISIVGSEPFDLGQAVPKCIKVIRRYEETSNPANLKAAMCALRDLLWAVIESSRPHDQSVVEAAIVTLLSYEPNHHELSDEEIAHIRLI